MPVPGLVGVDTLDSKRVGAMTVRERTLETTALNSVSWDGSAGSTRLQRVSHTRA
jgi:hypothetical protein